MVRERVLGRKEKRFARSLNPFSRGKLRGHNIEARGMGLKPITAPPLGKTHFASVSKIVKRLIGVSHPIVFIDDIVSFSKVTGKEALESIKRQVAKKYIDKKPSSDQINRMAYTILRDLSGPGAALVDPKTLKCYVYVDRYATYLFSALNCPIKTERDATDYKNSIVAHEVGQVLYSVQKMKQGKQVSVEVGEFVGRFFEFDYLLKRNPKFGIGILRNYRKDGQAGFIYSPSEDHNVASKFVAEFFEKIKDSRRRRQLVREIARRDFKGIAEVRAFVLG